MDPIQRIPATENAQGPGIVRALPRVDADGVDAEPQIDTSKTIGKLALALSRAQGAMTAARYDSMGAVGKEGGRRYGYASLASVWAAVRAPLAANELAIVQTTAEGGPTGVCVVTWLVHSSGEWMRGKLFLPVRQADAQGFGSALTYARRYALSAVVGIAPDDDDGAQAVATAPAPPSQPAAEEPIETEAQIRERFAASFASVKDVAQADLACERAVELLGGSRASAQRKKVYYGEKDKLYARLASAKAGVT